MSPGSPRILLVEDNPDTRPSLHILLKMRGHDVEEGEDRPGGVDKALVWQPGVAVVDIGQRETGAGFGPAAALPPGARQVSPAGAHEANRSRMPAPENVKE